MTYDFTTLSPDDFGNLVADLLSREWGRRLESFKPGKDRGIDLRNTRVLDETATAIVQCKRYAPHKFAELNGWVRPRWETYRVREFEQPAVRAAIEDWLKSLWRSPKNPNGLAPKMVRSIYNVMKLAFKYGCTKFRHQPKLSVAVLYKNHFAVD
jgi:hypothetical protein